MKRKNYILLSILVFVMICGILSLNSCKKNKVPDPVVTGPAGFHITVSGTANPSTLYVPASDPAVASTITAVVRDNQGNPLTNTKVIFESGAFGYFENFAISDFRMTNSMGEAQIVYFIGPGANVKTTVSNNIKLTVPTDSRTDIPVLAEVVDYIPIEIIPYITQGIILSGYIRTPTGNGVEAVAVTLTGEGGSPSGVVVTRSDGYYEFFVAAGWYGRIEPLAQGYSFTPSSYDFDSTNPINIDRTDLDFIADFEGGQTLAVDVTSWDVPVEGGTQEVNVYNSTGDAHIDYTIIPSDSWIQVSRRNGTTPGHFTINIDENTTGQPRTGSIEINATSVENSKLTINISQASNEVSSDARLEVDRTAVNFDQNAGLVTIQVYNRETSETINYIITSEANWITPSKLSGATDDTFDITVTQNYGVSRWADVVLTVTSTGVANKEVRITVSQDPGASIVVDPAAFTVDGDKSSSTAVLIDNPYNDDVLTWTATNLDTWIYFTPASGTTGNSITITVQNANPTSNPRTAVITITASNGATATITVTQEGN
jgi:hypothetical protein